MLDGGILKSISESGQLQRLDTEEYGCCWHGEEGLYTNA